MQCLGLFRLVFVHDLWVCGCVCHCYVAHSRLVFPLASVLLGSATRSYINSRVENNNSSRISIKCVYAALVEGATALNKGLVTHVLEPRA